MFHQARLEENLLNPSEGLSRRAWHAQLCCSHESQRSVGLDIRQMSARAPPLSVFGAFRQLPNLSAPELPCVAVAWGVPPVKSIVRVQCHGAEPWTSPLLALC